MFSRAASGNKGHTMATNFKFELRDISDMRRPVQIYSVNCNNGILNDPVLLRIEENHYWLSLADSDILLWAKGVLINSGMDVQLL